MNETPDETTPWLDRVRREDELLQQLANQTTQALERRARALADGLADTGSVYRVAQLTGHSWPAVNNAIKKYAKTT